MEQGEIFITPINLGKNGVPAVGVILSLQDFRGQEWDILLFTWMQLLCSMRWEQFLRILMEIYG